MVGQATVDHNLKTAAANNFSKRLNGINTLYAWAHLGQKSYTLREGLPRSQRELPCAQDILRLVGHTHYTHPMHE
jgi:hypothetical protein